MTNCPWCGAEPFKMMQHSYAFAMWRCDSYTLAEHRSPQQSQTCRIRELEAEAAGVAGLKKAGVEYDKAVRNCGGLSEEDNHNDIVRKRRMLFQACREYAKAKEKADEPAN